MILDDLIPSCHFSEKHAAPTRASPKLVYASIITLDLSQSALVKMLYALRGLPRTSLTLAGMSRVGFNILGKDEDREVAIGIVGRFWKRAPELIPVSPADFKAFNEKGYAKAAFNFAIAETAEGTVVSTETRVFCTSPGAYAAFFAYWALIRPFSGLIRRAMLKNIVRSAERNAAAPSPR